VTALGRAFVAVVPPPDVLDAVEAVVAPQRSREPGLRWADRHQWHVTLQFLGRVHDVGSLDRELAESLRTRPAVRGVRLGGAGAFPRSARGTVAWLGVRDGARQVTTLAAAVMEVTARQGWVGDGRPFHPHLTVARSPRPRRLTGAVAGLEVPTVGEAWDLTEVVLFESDPQPGGAVHVERARYPLSG
jgi:2'-5' RNA ligase